MGHICLNYSSRRERISIHPPPARWDTAWSVLPCGYLYFNPPTSCEVGLDVSHKCCTVIFQSTHLLRGGTQMIDQSRDALIKFQSTHLLRGGTRYFIPMHPTSQFQSTHLLRGGTRWVLVHGGGTFHFNPPTSCEVGPRRRYIENVAGHFNPPTSCEVGPSEGGMNT